MLLRFQYGVRPSPLLPLSTSISRPNTTDNQRFPPPCGTTRRRVGVVTASKSIQPRLSQFNEGESHPATFWNSARLLPRRPRYQALKRVYWDKLMGIQRGSITNYTQKVIGAYIWILSQWLRVTLAVDWKQMTGGDLVAAFWVHTYKSPWHQTPKIGQVSNLLLLHSPLHCFHWRFRNKQNNI